MKLTAILLTITCLHVAAGGYSQRVTLSVKDASLKTVFVELNKQTGYNFLYTDEAIAKTNKVTLTVQNAKLEDVLNLCFKNQPLIFSIVDNSIIIKEKMQPIYYPNSSEEILIDVKGRITNENGEALAGATISVRGTDKKTITDKDGYYILNLMPGNYTIEITYVGYEPFERRVTIKDGEAIAINAVLKPKEDGLGEVVVTGYGQNVSRQKLTSTITKVKSKDIVKVPVSTFTQALQGQVPGMNVQTVSGAPGGGTVIKIRGQNSLNANTNPLYVVDGVPVVDGNIGTLWNNIGTNTSTSGAFKPQQDLLSLINPNDIESIEILRDAGAKAIYGARAANGVVLITTKKGIAGAKPIFSFNAQYGFVKETKRLEVLQTPDYLQFLKEAYTNDGLAIPSSLANADSVTNTDWQSEIYRPGKFQDYQLSVSGGDQKIKYYISGSFRDETGIVIKNDMQRGTIRLNLDVTPSNKYAFGARFSYAADRNNVIFWGATATSPIFLAWLTPPNLPVFDANRNYTPNPNVLNLNPVQEIMNSKYTNYTSKLVGNFYFRYNILKNLIFQTDVSTDLNRIRQDWFSDQTTFAGRSVSGLSTMYNREINLVNIEPTIRFSQNFIDKLSVNIIVGGTTQNQNEWINSSAGQNFALPNVLNYNVSAGSYVASSSGGGTQSNRRQYSFNSLFTRIGFDWDSKYLVQFNFRRDGSSRFGANNRFGNFGSVSGAWVFTKEKIFERIRWISTGKLRSSWGITGNDRIVDFQFLDSWTIGLNGGFAGASGTLPTRLPNPNLRWEQNTTTDVGLELGFFKNRIALNATWFKSRNEGLLFSKPVPGTSGFNTLFQNVGVVENRGFEIELNTVNVETKYFQWSSSFNISLIKNKVVRLINNNPIVSTINQVLLPGSPVYSYYLIKFLGVDPATGNSIFEDFNKDGVINQNDRQVLEKAQPDFFGGFTNNFRYKNFEMNILFQFAKGNWVYNQPFANNFTGGTNLNNPSALVLNRWRKSGDITDVPRASRNSSAVNYQVSSRYIEDGSFIRFRNISLAYNLAVPNSKSINNLRFFITGNNLFVWTKYTGQDPEVGDPGNDAFNYPQVRTFTVGVTVNF